MPSRVVDRIKSNITTGIISGIPDGWPTSAAGLTAAFGGYGTWVSAWGCDDTSGNLTDLIGTNHLVPGLTPTYRNTGAFSGDFAVGFDTGTADRFVGSSSTVFNMGVSSIAMYCCIKISTVTNRYFMGKGATRIMALVLESAPNGRITAQVADGVDLAQSTIAADHSGGLWHDVLFVLDRTAERIQAFSNLGTGTAVDTTLVGNLDSATLFHVGSLASSNIFGCQIAYAAVATGDIINLRANGAAAIANIRRFTGRV